MKPTFKIVTLFLFIFTITTSAQKIKIKKGKVLVDNVAISLFEADGEDYVFTDLKDNSKVFKVDFKSIRRDKKIIKKWLLVTNKDKSKTTEIEMEYLSMTLSNKKAIAELFFTKYQILTLTGIDSNKLKSFLEENRPSQSEIATSILEGDLQKKKVLNNLNINVDAKNKTIFKGNISTSNQIGKYVISDTKSSFKYGVILIYDLDNTKIVSVTPGFSRDNDVQLINQKTKFSYTVKSEYRNNPYHEALFIKELVQQLFDNNVTLGHQIKDTHKENYELKQEVRKNEVEEFKKNSNNIYYTKGYIIDEKEGKREGEIQFIVEKLKDNSGIVDLDEATIGQRVSLKYQNKKGKTRFDTFKSKAEEKFCIYNKDNSETCFIGMRAKGKGVELATRGLSSLSFDTSYYYQIIKENDNIGIYKDITYSTKYLVKVKNQKKALQFNTNNKDKNLEQIKEYFNNSIDLEEVLKLDFSKEEDVLKLLKLYKN